MSYFDGLKQVIVMIKFKNKKYNKIQFLEYVIIIYYKISNKLKKSNSFPSDKNILIWCTIQTLNRFYIYIIGINIIIRLSL